MLKSIVEKLEDLSKSSWTHAEVRIDELNSVLQAAKLLIEVHAKADAGELDGVDLEWMAKADDLLVGARED